ncbi:hypothetical protein EDD17DRAFT_1570092 [Pisolithus thermaeus]|nr:hypothetical protein EDD17DRAFT_1570092 [Pisolithus thermaeus]
MTVHPHRPIVSQSSSPCSLSTSTSPPSPVAFIPSAIPALMSFDVGPDILLPSFVISSCSQVSLHAAPTPNSSYVLGSYPSSMLSLFRLGSQPSEWGATNSPTLSDVEPQVVEVFKSKDRYIFKHGEQTECLPTRLGLTPATFYQRLLLCSCSAEADPVNSMISITLTMESRITIRRRTA